MPADEAPQSGKQVETQSITKLLNDAAAGRPQAASELLPLVYAQLHALAESYFRHERRSHTLQPTALVHEAYLKLVDERTRQWESRRQFFVIAAHAMRNILVDHARAKRRLKRGGGWQEVTLEAVQHNAGSENELDLIALDAALHKLGALDERKARLVELRFFVGMTGEEAADVLEISRTTAAMEWRMARAWLYRELEGC